MVVTVVAVLVVIMLVTVSCWFLGCNLEALIGCWLLDVVARLLQG